MPRENSITGFRAALARYQRDYLCGSDLRELNANMLSRVYEQFVKHLSAVQTAVESALNSETAVKGPFAACPMCHIECFGGTGVCLSALYSRS